MAIVLLLAAIFIARKSSDKYHKNYKTFFILGIVWLPIGISTDNPGLWILGIIFLSIGLLNRSKWQDQPKWSELPPDQRKIKLILIAILLVILILGVAAFFTVEKVESSAVVITQVIGSV